MLALFGSFSRSHDMLTGGLAQPRITRKWLKWSRHDPPGPVRSGLDGQEQERGEQRQVHATLEADCATGHDGEDADDDGQTEQHDLDLAQPEESGPSSQMEAIAMAGMVSPMLAIAEPRARLRLVCRRFPMRGAYRRDGLGQQHEQRDDDADDRSPGTRLLDGRLDRGRLHLGQPDHGDERDQQQPEAGQCVARRWAAMACSSG